MYKFSMLEYSYSASKTIQYNLNRNSEIKVKYGVKNPKNPTGTNVKMKISSSSYHNYVTRIKYKMY
jgi:hypothetical protein